MRLAQSVVTLVLVYKEQRFDHRVCVVCGGGLADGQTDGQTDRHATSGMCSPETHSPLNECMNE